VSPAFKPKPSKARPVTLAETGGSAVRSPKKDTFTALSDWINSLSKKLSN
jgi:hypothetical protein